MQVDGIVMREILYVHTRTRLNQRCYYLYIQTSAEGDRAACDVRPVAPRVVRGATARVVQRAWCNGAIHWQMNFPPVVQSVNRLALRWCGGDDVCWPTICF